MSKIVSGNQRVIRCCECSQPAIVGTRCFKHYVRRLARDRGLFKYRWFSVKFNRFVNMLRGRYALLLLGSEPPSRTELIRAVWTTDPRPFWLTHKSQSHCTNYGVNTYEQVHSLIDTVDARAKEKP
jgi:hypothetical protein